MELKVTSNREFVSDFEDIVRAFGTNVALGDNGAIVAINFMMLGDDCIVTLAEIAENSRKKDSIATVSTDDRVCGAELDGKDNNINPCRVEKTSTNGDNIEYSDNVILGKLVLENSSKMTEVKSKSELKRLGKVLLYDYITSRTGIVLPYGSLTGIRPTRLYSDVEREGKNAAEYFTDFLRVDPIITSEIAAIVENQRIFIETCDDEIDLFVNIPICQTRCAYCSFLAMTYKHAKPFLEEYLTNLIAEIKHALALMVQVGRKLRAVYVGGGTPTSLSDDEFARVMAALSNLNATEFTVEAGRPDSITEVKLDAMQSAGVTRVSINPQTFKESTLALIGRGHTNEQLYTAFNWARARGFDINMDLIAMLPEESLEDFAASVAESIRLAPENITVHTLAIKRGSNLKNGGYDNSGSELAVEMVTLSKSMLKGAGYLPYYMYKQKYMSGSLENTGYTQPGKTCVYNIDIMEERQSILACGAGGISKRIFAVQNRLERLANAKGLDIYNERASNMLGEKEKFFS